MANQVLDYISRGGLIGFLIYFYVYAIPNKKWVPGWLYDEAIERTKVAEQRYNDMTYLAQRGTAIAEKAASVAEKIPAEVVNAKGSTQEHD